MKKLQLISILTITVFAAFLYTYELANIPNGLYVDEALTGYNAYSILATRLDEYGKSYPVAFRFLGSYTPPLQVYLTVPFIKLLGLNVFATRLPSAIFAIITVPIIYFFLD